MANAAAVLAVAEHTADVAPPGRWWAHDGPYVESTISQWVAGRTGSEP